MLGAVISDLHLFSGRSRGIEELYQLIDDQPDLSLLILNGDIFDFKWNQHQDRDEGYREAQDIYRQLCQRYPKLTVIYLSGNHDQEVTFETYIKELMQQEERFLWFSDFLQIGNKLFHHGDLFFQKKHSRFPILAFPTKSSALYQAYKGITTLQLNRVVEPALQPERVCPYIEKHWSQYFDQRGVTDIYFGHTHVPFEGFEVKGRRYHNSGTFIKNQKYEFLCFSITREELKKAGSLMEGKPLKAGNKSP